MTWREELAWSAGFYDGEGCTSRSKNSCTISIKQNDPEVLLRFQRAMLGVGMVKGPYEGQGNSKRYWLFTAGGSNAQAIIAMLWGFLGTVKREQALRRLRETTFRGSLFQDGVDHGDKVCRRGHPYTGNRTRSGQCRPCMTQLGRERPLGPRPPKDVCKRGHPYEGNRTPKGQCRPCLALLAREYRQKKRA